jgi:hypothetical protein
MAALAAAGLALLAAAPERGDPVARISTAPNASEYWDFVIALDGGERMFARFLISNEGPGEASGVAVGHYLRADGTVVPLRNGRLAGSWTLAEDRRSLRVGSSRLAFTGSDVALDVDNDKRGVKIHLRAQLPPRVSAGPELPDTNVDLLALAAPIEGTVWFTGMSEPRAVRGSAGISHTWMDPRESERMLRRLDFFGRDGERSVYVGDALAPSGSRAHVIILDSGAKRLMNVTQITISHGEENSSDLGPEYPITRRLDLAGDGISGVIHIKTMLVRHEPLQDLPLPFRFLISSAAHPQRVWMESRFEVRIGADSPSSTPLLLQGSGITSVTFTNPLPSKTSKRHVTD